MPRTQGEWGGGGGDDRINKKFSNNNSNNNRSFIIQITPFAFRGFSKM